ncbi:MAG: Ig-like domain-containing protein [Polaromonas sp.]
MRTIPVSDTRQVRISGKTVVINPTTDLHAGTAYHVLVGATAITNTAGNRYVWRSKESRSPAGRDRPASPSSENRTTNSIGNPR